jgi:hypothetical protein
MSGTAPHPTVDAPSRAERDDLIAELRAVVAARDPLPERLATAVRALLRPRANGARAAAGDDRR